MLADAVALVVSIHTYFQCITQHAWMVVWPERHCSHRSLNLDTMHGRNSRQPDHVADSSRCTVHTDQASAVAEAPSIVFEPG